MYSRDILFHMNTTYDVIIFGGGPAGLTAALYTSRASLKALVIAGNPPGGQLMWTTEVENYPGFPDSIMGPELISNFRKQSERFDATFIDANVAAITGSFEEGFTVTTDLGGSHNGKTIIVATGASARWLELPSEQRLRGKGVSACATCDGFFFKNRVVAIVGGGDAAMEEAIFMTKFSPKIYVLVRGTQECLRASKIMQARALANHKIEFLFSTEIIEVLGEESVTGLKTINNKTQESTTLDDVTGLFIAIGHKPNTDFLKDFIDLGKFGYINVTDNTKSSQKGVFVAGDVADYKYRQAVTAAGLGCMAALDVEKLLSEHV